MLGPAVLLWFGTQRGEPADPGPDSGAGLIGIARGRWLV